MTVLSSVSTDLSGVAAYLRDLLDYPFATVGLLVMLLHGLLSRPSGQLERLSPETLV